MKTNYLEPLDTYENDNESVQSNINNPKIDKLNTGKSKKLIPDNTLDLLALAKRVAEEWSKREHIKISWTSVDDLQQKIRDLEDALSRKHKKISQRSPIVADLKDLDSEIRKNLNYVKQFISYRFGKDKAQSHYIEFGIVRSKGGRFILGEDREHIEDALKKLVEAVNKYNMDHDEFGKQYWQNVYQRYVDLKTQSIKLTQASAGDVKDLKKLKDDIKKILVAVKDAIKVNYKDDYKLVLQEFGYLKTHN